ncbi:complement factor H-related protein 1-like [Odontesthes bonariensis]
MGVSCLGFAVLVWIPGVLHAQRTGQPCRAPTLNGGYFLPEEESYPHETKISYSCDDGLKPGVKGWWATSTCQNGKWSHEPQCINEKACIPPNIPNAKYTESSNGWYEEGHAMAVTCNDGYVNKNLAATACIGGAWFPVPVCEKSNTACSEPPNFPHAVIIHQEYQEVYEANSKIEYNCEDGYVKPEPLKKFCKIKSYNFKL